jgi:hypothetical protein
MSALWQQTLPPDVLNGYGKSTQDINHKTEQLCLIQPKCVGTRTQYEILCCINLKTNRLINLMV